MSLNRSNRYRAFSLFEAVIVLGVVGLVIAGMWVAASAVNTTLKVNKTVEGILYMAVKGQGFLPMSMVTGTWYDITSTAIAAGIYPSDWVTSGVISTPIGNWSIVAIDGWTPPDTFIIYISVPNESICRKLVNALGKSYQSSIIQYIWNDDKGIGRALPVSHNDSICNPPITRLAFKIIMIRSS